MRISAQLRPTGRSRQRRAVPRWVTTTVLAASLGLASACGGGSPEPAAQNGEELIPVRVGLPSSNYWPGYVARDEQLYREAGFEPTFVKFTTGAPLIAALQSDSIDVVFTGLATLFAVQQGVPLTYLYTPLDSSSQEGLVVSPDSGVVSYEDLAKARTIAAPTATCAHIALVMAADKAGVDFRKLQTSNVAPNLLQAAFDKKEIDAAFIWGPWNLQLEEAGYDIVSWDADYQPDGGVCATNVAARPDFLADYPSAGCRLVMAHDLALKAAEEDPTLGPATLVAELGVSPQVAQETYDTLNIPTLASQLEEDSPWSVTGTERGLSTKLHLASDALQRAGVFPSALSQAEVSEHIDPEPLRQFVENGTCA